MEGSLGEEPQYGGAARTGEDAVDAALTGVQISMLQDLQRGVVREREKNKYEPSIGRSRRTSCDPDGT